MDLYLQYGYGMKGHCLHLLRRWGGGTVVLSPRDLYPATIGRTASEILSVADSKVLVDPQFYLPHSDHQRLVSHDYWPSEYATGAFWQGPALRNLLESLANLNDETGASAFITPGLLSTEPDPHWTDRQQAFLTGALDLELGVPVLQTIALAPDIVKDNEQVEQVIEACTAAPADGYYLVCQHPSGAYLVNDDPIWLGNVLELIAGLRELDVPVVLAYCNHQMLIAACAGATAICSGTWMNLRHFGTARFQANIDGDPVQRAKWWYCPASLSEYKIPFLDLAHDQGVLGHMEPPPDLNGGYFPQLFAGPQPSSLNIREPQCFRHYLHALHGQVRAASHATFSDTASTHAAQLDQAENLIELLGNAGVRGQARDFEDAIDVNRAALARLESTRGPMLRRHWRG